jgi:DNA-binding CsgD family transcriptional regulator
MAPGTSDLTEKERQALRLLGQGHDAKSIARHLGLSIHTINERLRDARRKLATSSSREAARLLRAQEGPEFFGDKSLGADTAPAADQSFPQQPSKRMVPLFWLIGGFAMLIALAGLALAFALPNAATAPDATTAATDAPAVAAARGFMAMIDADDWDASWHAAGEGIRARNSVASWTAASRSLRASLGKPGRRELLTIDLVPGPPNGLTVVKFRTDYARKPGAVETLTLAREGDSLRVVGISIG